MNTVQERLAFLCPQLQVAPCTAPSCPACCIANFRASQTFPVAPCRAPHFSCLPKNSKQKKAPRHPGLRFAQTSLAPVLGLLRGTAGLPNPLCRVENAACGFSTERSLVDNAARLSTLRITFKHARTDSPVRRVSGIGAEGVKSQGCDESCAEPWTAQRSGPLERRWTTAWMQEVERRRMPKPSERTRFAALRRNGPDAGGAFSLLTFSLRKQTKRSEVTAAGWPEGRAKRVKESDAPCRAQPVVESRGTCNQPSRCPRLHEKTCRSAHP